MKTTLFKNLTLIDFFLASLFILIVALLANSLFPPNGWWIGILISLILLYLAKRRRDRLQQEAGSEEG